MPALKSACTCRQQRSTSCGDSATGNPHSPAKQFVLFLKRFAAQNSGEEDVIVLIGNLDTVFESLWPTTSNTVGYQSPPCARESTSRVLVGQASLFQAVARNYWQRQWPRVHLGRRPRLPAVAVVNPQPG